MPGVLTTISDLGGGKPQPLGNAETIVNALGAKGKPWESTVRTAAETGLIPPYTGAGCGGGAGGPGVGTQLGVVTAQAGLAGAASFIKVGTKALDAIPVVGSLIGAAISLISAPFQHHAQAVRTEQTTLCVAVPDAQNFLALVDQYVQSGQWDYVTAVKEMEAGFAAWRTEVSSILKDTAGQCNAACYYEMAFRAAIEKRKLDYQQAEVTLGNAGKNLVNSVSNSVGGIVQKVTDFLKGNSGTSPQSVVLSPNVRLLLTAGLIVVFAGGTYWIFSHTSRRVTA